MSNAMTATVRAVQRKGLMAAVMAMLLATGACGRTDPGNGVVGGDDAAPAVSGTAPIQTQTASAVPLTRGSHAPAFAASAWRAGEAFQFRLEDALAAGPVVVYFFPAAFTPGCNIEARQFSEAMPQFEAQGVTVVGVTAGNTDQLQAFSADNETCAGRFAVAADPGATIARQYGAISGMDAARSNRTSFAIDRDGRILAVHSAAQPSQHVERMLAAVAPR